MSSILEDYQQTNLWKVFQSKANYKELGMVEDLIKSIIPLQEEYAKTFPNYTDHSGIHQRNVLVLIGELLGNRLNELTILECAILILSTYFHDLGMVFTEDERADLSSEERFGQFLSGNPKAKLQFLKNNEVLSPDLAEWYCRWNHAFRVHEYLERFERKNPSCLRWKGASLRVQLGLVCESHNWPAMRLKEDEFETDYLSGEADLKFCSLLLRLADYLDFDDSRAPRSLFDFLKLDKPKNTSEQISQREWLKHQASAGFKFPDKERDRPYALTFLASPRSITIEQEIRLFLNGIEEELGGCSKVVRYCSERWQSFALPESIKRDIRSQGYQYGDFKFSLDQKQILNLLMGENLYDEPYIFIRELLQNAIDTARHREFEERGKGNEAFKAEPIDVSMWEDLDGYQWIRIDDYGIGMSQSIIEKFLLNVGNSYYNSDEFKIEQLRYQSKGLDFTPISRFGIGILSCFIVGDKVEINTKKEGFPPVRLSVNGLYNYYTLQTDKDIPNSMPHKLKDETYYRKKTGTSIAVRIDPAKEGEFFDMKETLEKWLFFSPVPIRYDNILIGGDFIDLDKPLCEEFTEWLTPKQLKEAEDFLDEKFPNGLGITVRPFNLTEESYNKNLLRG